MTTTLPKIHPPFEINGIRYLHEEHGTVHRLYKIIPDTMGEVELLTEGTTAEVRKATFALFHPSPLPPHGGDKGVGAVPSASEAVAESRPLKAESSRTVLYHCAITGSREATTAHRRELGMNGYTWKDGAWQKHRIPAVDLMRERTFAESLNLTFTATEEALT